MFKTDRKPFSSSDLSFQPRSPISEKTATLSDLLNALNSKVIKENGELITLKSLKRTLEFLKKAIGLEVKGKNHPLPLTVLKTIRILFLADYNHSKNVLRLLAPPQADGIASMEFSTVTTIPRDEEASSLIQELSGLLALEIDPSRIEMLSQALGQREKHSVSENILLHFEYTNDAVSKILHDAFGDDEDHLTEVLHSLTTPLNQFRVEPMEGRVPPANEAMYTYLQTLPFLHFIQHYPKHLEATRIRGEIGCITEEAERLCQVAAQGTLNHHRPASRVFSVSTFHHLLREYPEEMCELVHKATGIPTTVRQLQAHRDRVRPLLISYAYRSFDCTDPDATVLSVYDAVAAFCSFRHQQVDGDHYKPYWHGQTDQGKNPQRLFDKGLSDGHPYQYQGVLQIYLNRFYEYRASFLGNIDSYRAWMNYQVAVLGAYRSVLDLKDIVAVAKGLTTLNVYCIAAAEDLVFDLHRVHR